MVRLDQSNVGNTLLRTISAQTFGRLAHGMERVDLPPNMFSSRIVSLPTTSIFWRAALGPWSPPVPTTKLSKWGISAGKARPVCI
ncbi:hypothetical protein FHX16_004053 [Rhizobium sp. BK661]|nr:hypothetical protein [Rhizobium sp. BK661]